MVTRPKASSIEHTEEKIPSGVSLLGRSLDLGGGRRDHVGACISRPVARQFVDRP